MIEVFKNWISSMLCIGIFVTLIQLIIPKTNLKKYIYTLLGIITIITLISPIVQVMKNGTIEESVKNVLANISGDSNSSELETSKYQGSQEELVKNQFIETLKSDIENKLKEKSVIVKNTQVFLASNYDVEKLEISIEKIQAGKSTIESVHSIVEYIHKEYDIAYEKISVVEGDM